MVVVSSISLPTAIWNLNLNEQNMRSSPGMSGERPAVAILTASGFINKEKTAISPLD